MTVTQRVTVGGSLTVFVVTAALIARVVTWYLSPAAVLTNLQPGVRRVDPVTVRPGEILRYWPGPDCKVVDVPGTLSRSFVGDLVFQTPARAADRAVNCRELDDAEGVDVPNLPPGRYHLVVTLSYKVNPLRDVIYRYETEEFTVEGSR